METLSSDLIALRFPAKFVLITLLMISRRKVQAALTTALVAMVGCVHTPPGTSVEVALAKKAELIRLPNKGAVATGGHRAQKIEPELPLLDDRIEAVAEAYTRGKFAVSDGHFDEAIAAFEETVRLDPTHTEAWQYLAQLYEKTGAEKKALAAYRKSKATVTH